MSNKLKKVIMAALFAALCCVTTLVVTVPSPLGGFINLGDSIVLLCGWLLGPLFGGIAAAVGSALADVFLGYYMYAPATFVIKGLMAVLAFLLFRLLRKSKLPMLIARILSAAVAELLMIGGYYLFEGCLFGFWGALVNVPFNALQAVAGIAVGCILIQLLRGIRITDK